MALDPSIALGVRPLELANPLAQYGQLAQLQNAQNQNALAQYQLSSAQRLDEQQNNLYAAAKQPNFKLDLQTAIQYGPAGIAALKTQNEAATAALTQTKTQAEIEEKQLKNRNDKLNFAYNSVGSAPTPEAAAQKIKEGLKDGFLDFNTATAELKQIQDLRTPEDFQQYRLKKLMGILKEKDKVEFMLPKIKQQEAGGNILGIQDNPTMPGYGLPIAGMAIKKTATIGEQTAQGQLGLAKQKFAWEQANPGFEIKEDLEGNMFGVNKRTLQAVPVTVGGGAPAAAPAALGAGMPGPRMAQPGVVQAIPGMTSVLDQAAPAVAAAPVAGGPRQLVGKGQALTESQGNATAYGMRMKEANSILAPLEKSGFKNTGLISNVVGGTLGIVPLIGDKLEGMSGSVFNALPQILGGLSPEQQQVSQARINFITAVLRKESGAAISPSEFITAEKNYFPKPGDDASVVSQKQKARNLAIKAMEIQAGPGAKNIQQFAPSGSDGGLTGATANNPLGLPGL